MLLSFPVSLFSAPNGQKPSYEKVFQLFDDNDNGQISSDEFKSLMLRWKLLGPSSASGNSMPDKEIQKLIDMFDKTRKGYIDYQDFLRFMEVDKYADADIQGIYLPT